MVSYLLKPINFIDLNDAIKRLERKQTAVTNQQRISALLPDIQVRNSSEIGIPTDAKEAVLFALLANETIMDAGATKVRRLGDSPWVTMGKISF